MHKVLVGALCLVIAGCTLAPVAPSSDAAFGTSQAVVTGHALHYPDGLVVTLQRIDDSRCRRGVQCIWAGELAPVLGLQGGRLPQAQTLALGTQRSRAADAGPYRLELLDATESSVALQVSDR